MRQQWKPEPASWATTHMSRAPTSTVLPGAAHAETARTQSLPDDGRGSRRAHPPSGFTPQALQDPSPGWSSPALPVTLSHQDPTWWGVLPLLAEPGLTAASSDSPAFLLLASRGPRVSPEMSPCPGPGHCSPAMMSPWAPTSPLR